ncbi:MAG: hypothetical protein ACKN8Y_02795, partial [Polynucleobacter victoriensis]
NARLSESASSGECCDSNEGFFHFKVLQGLNRGSELFRTNLRFREVARIEPDACGLAYDNCQKYVDYVASLQQTMFHPLANPCE